MLRARRPGWSATQQSSGWGKSTDAELAWGKSRAATARWAVAGVVVGALLALPAFAPAAWLARALASASGERLLLADARGSVWAGSAVLVLSGGPQSRDASALPGRLAWRIAPRLDGLELALSQPCCLNDGARVRLRPSWGGMAIALDGASGPVGQWPSAWLSGLGTPFNTLQLGGLLQLASNGLLLQFAQGRWQLTGGAELALLDVSSRLTPLDSLGSYRLRVRADPADPVRPAIELTTDRGALQLSGRGSLGQGGIRFRGEARAASDDTVLSNLLNIIGRRDGARSIISIG